MFSTEPSEICRLLVQFLFLMHHIITWNNRAGKRTRAASLLVWMRSHWRVFGGKVSDWDTFRCRHLLFAQELLSYVTFKALCSSACPLPSALWPLPFNLRAHAEDGCDHFSVCKTVIRWPRPDGAGVVQWRMRCCPRRWKVPPALFLTFCFLLQDRTYKKWT